jgi:hypothetical protein
MVKNLKRKKHKIEISDSDSESINESIGRQFTGIWKQFSLGEEVSRGIYKGKCIHCDKEFNRAKPTKTRAHIAHNCPKCPESIKRYYNYLIANNLFDDPKVEDYTIPIEAHSEIKSFKTTSKKKNFKSAKLTEFHKIEIDEALIAAFISCGLPFNIIENPFFINLLKVLCSEYDLPSREVLAGMKFNKLYIIKLIINIGFFNIRPIIGYSSGSS